MKFYLLKVGLFCCLFSGMGSQWPSYLGKLSKSMFIVGDPEDKEVTHSKNCVLCSK